MRRPLLLDEPAGLDGWYHSIDLGGGRVTRGIFDLRRYVDTYGLPERMNGLRALDIGTQDGFWAFEMERRGAEVLALNHPTGGQDRPPRARRTDGRPNQDGRFQLAKAQLGSRVDHVSLYVSDVRPEEIGTFDLVIAGSVLIHVRDQLLALERIASVCRGTFISAEPYDFWTAMLPFPAARFRGHSVERYRTGRGDSLRASYYWKPSLRAWRQMIWAAGFDEVERRGVFRLRSTVGFSVRQVVHHARGARSDGRDAAAGERVR